MLFRSQKIDAAGRTGVTLQKWLIFFAICDTIIAVLGLPYSIVGLTITLCILSLGFFGAYKRNTCLLRAYMVVRIIGAILHLVLALGTGFLIAVFIGLFTYEYDNGYFYEYQDYITEYYPWFVAIGVIVTFVSIFTLIVYLGFVIYTVVLAHRVVHHLKSSKQTLPTQYYPMQQFYPQAIPIPVPYDQLTTPGQIQLGTPIYLQPVNLY